MSKTCDLAPFNPPKGYSYSVEKFDSKYLRVWIHNHFPFSYKEGAGRAIWGFIRIKDGQIVAPINAQKPGKPISVENITAYSAMQRPLEEVSQHVGGVVGLLL